MDRYPTIPQSASLTAPFTQGGLIIGITGGTGSGKTTLLDIIRELGGIVLDCDAIYHELLKTDRELLAAIDRRFPGTVCDGSLDRKKLGNIVFTDENALGDLNAITHAAVKAEVLRQLESAPTLAAIDAIGLFEGGLAQLCDVTVAVTAPEAQRIARLIARDGITEAYARKRIRAQKSDREFSALCDHTLTNDTTPETFRTKCLAFLRQLGIMKEEP
ncbi:MAG: dephospho-CoA kinase [Oscillospiraceae bacterium]|nr:dephospho-CoA kinase [Oscillospiraceae bacterium]